MNIENWFSKIWNWIFILMNLNLVSVKLNFASVKMNFVSVKLNFVSVKLNFVSVKLNFVYVKLNFVCVKLIFVSVKLNFVCEKSTWKWYSILLYIWFSSHLKVISIRHAMCSMNILLEKYCIFYNCYLRRNSSGLSRKRVRKFNIPTNWLPFEYKFGTLLLPLHPTH